MRAGAHALKTPVMAPTRQLNVSTANLYISATVTTPKKTESNLIVNGDELTKDIQALRIILYIGGFTSPLLTATFAALCQSKLAKKTLRPSSHHRGL